MDEKRIRYCKVCGAAYESCYGCEKAKSWRIHTDTADHYYILTVLMEYKATQDVMCAYESLRKRGVDFQSIDGYLPIVQKLLREIYDGFHGKQINAQIDGLGDASKQTFEAERGTRLSESNATDE